MPELSISGIASLRREASSTEMTMTVLCAKPMLPHTKFIYCSKVGLGSQAKPWR